MHGHQPSGDEPDERAVPRCRTRRCSIGQLVPGTGNLTNGIFLAGQGIVETSYKWPTLALAPRFGLAYDVGGNQKIILARRHRTLLRPARRQLDLRPGGQPAERVDGDDQLRAAAEPDVDHQRPAGADGLRVRRRSCRRRCSGARALQMALPWSSVLDVSYVGQYGYNLGQTVDINQVDIGAAYQAQNQDPTLLVNGAGRQRGRDRPDARLSRLRADQPVLGPRLEQVPLAPDVVQPPLHRRRLVRPELDARPVRTRPTPAPAWSTRPTARCGTARIRRRRTSCSAAASCSATRSRATSCGICPTSNERERRRDEGGRGDRQRLAAVRDLHRPVGRPLQHRLRLPERRRQRERHGLAELRRPRRHHRGPGVGLLGQPVPAVQHRRRSPDRRSGSVGPGVGPELPDRAASRTSGTWRSRATSAWAAAA